MVNATWLSFGLTSTLAITTLGGSATPAASPQAMQLAQRVFPSERVNPAGGTGDRVNQKLANSQLSNSDLPDYVITLVNAQRLDAAAIGYAAVKSPTYEAFEQTMAAGKSLYSQLQSIYPTATPVGKLYLAQVIQSVNPTAGQQLLRELVADLTPIQRMSGCLMMETTVGEVAKELLGSNLKPRANASWKVDRPLIQF
jgi:hypothetical protein